MTTRKGYLVALAVFLVGLAGAGLFFWRLSGRIDDLARVDMPGEQTATLPAGDLVAYAEQPPDGFGDVRVSASCAATDAAGAAIALEPPTTHTTYAIGGHAGTSLFELTVPTAGAVTLRCTSEQTFVLAIGPGFARYILFAVLSGLAGAVVGLGLVIRTWRRRRRERKAAAIVA